jgi:hypothetical protein
MHHHQQCTSPQAGNAQIGAHVVNGVNANGAASAGNITIIGTTVNKALIKRNDENEERALT